MVKSLFNRMSGGRGGWGVTGNTLTLFMENKNYNQISIICNNNKDRHMLPVQKQNRQKTGKLTFVGENINP